ncbi:septation protein A [Candidatus Endowatersipora endosymbiont of Watersipora subatra]|uniref:septation protein A n=1 Tax=Candidatus Endowatersipora endosymbiont of Watersipora subatra TaxID=3077946 RepID=UPI00312C8D80
MSTGKMNSFLKTLLEIAPMTLFVLAYNKADWFIRLIQLPEVLQKPIFLATVSSMIATLLTFSTFWLLTRTVPLMPLVTLVILFIFGGLTLYFKDDSFIKVKPTIINTLFGTILISGVILNHSFLKLILGTSFQIDNETWRILSLRWGLFFFFLAVLNEMIWRNFSEEFWVSFKFWGMTSLSFLFMLTQVPLIIQRSNLREENKD